MNRILMLVTTAAIVGAGSAARATTYNFSGDFCDTSSTDVQRHPVWGLYNVSTTREGYVHCPIMVANTPGGIRTVSITIYNRSGGFMSCGPIITDAYSHATYAAPIQTITGSAPGPQTMTFTYPSGTGAFGVVSCTLPPATAAGYSHMANYSVSN